MGELFPVICSSWRQEYVIHTSFIVSNRSLIYGDAPHQLGVRVRVPLFFLHLPAPALASSHAPACVQFGIDVHSWDRGDHHSGTKHAKNAIIASNLNVQNGRRRASITAWHTTSDKPGLGHEAPADLVARRGSLAIQVRRASLASEGVFSAEAAAGLQQGSPMMQILAMMNATETQEDKRRRRARSRRVSLLPPPEVARGESDGEGGGGRRERRGSIVASHIREV